MASTLKLQLFRNIKPTVSISLDSPSKMSLVGWFPPMRHRLSRYYFAIMNIREDRLSEGMLKSGDIVLIVLMVLYSRV